MTRWRIDLDRKFHRYIDAAYTRPREFDPYGIEFVDAGGDVVFGITGSVRGFATATPIPTARLCGGPRDGEIIVLDGTAPTTLHFLREVPLLKIDAYDQPAPLTANIPEPECDTYVRVAACCSAGRCRRSDAGFEHAYVWPGWPDCGFSHREAKHPGR